MSSPSSIGGNNGSVGIREGTRVILREITANLQNSPPAQSPRRKSGNEASSLKGEQQQQQQQQHDVKVRFIREFADAGATGREAPAESSLSSASSFQSLTSTLSSKCSSGICVDSSPGKASDTSYLSADIPGLDDLISACENIRLGDTTANLSADQSFSLQLDAEDLSGDQTFASATDRVSLDRTLEISRGNSPLNFPVERTNSADVTRELETTRTLDAETEASLANAAFECGTVDVDEATRFHQANSELATSSVNETFVQCSSTLAQETPIVLVNGADEELKNAAKTENSQEALETPAEINISEVTNNIAEKPVEQLEPSTLSEVLEKSLKEPASDISAEEAKRLLLNETIELSTPEFFDEAKRLIQLDKTIELSTPALIDAPEKPSTTFESQSDFSVEEAACLGPLDSFKPSSLSDIQEVSQSSTFPSLPTLSSICLQAEVSETDAPQTDEVVTKVASLNENAPIAEEPAESLSEKFAQIVAQIAENDLCTANSISAIKEPTFLNAQKLQDDSAELNEIQSCERIDDIIVRREQSSIEQLAEIQSRELGIETADIAEGKNPEICEKEKSFTTNVEQVSAEVKPEGKEEQLEAVKVEVEDRIVSEVVEKRDADFSGGSEDLNATVTIQDISAGNLFLAPEADHYAEFLPQQQSTALGLDRQRVDLNKSGSAAAGPGLISGDNLVPRPSSVADEYAAFQPQKQSTNLAACFGDPSNKLERQDTPFVTAFPPPNDSSINGDIKTTCPKTPEPIDDRCNFAKLELAANAVANDIYNKSLELEEENDPFVTATGTELFTDPGGFEFLLSKTPRKNPNRNLRTESLYIKFDPLVSNTSMLPQGNPQTPSPPANEERNGENNTTIENLTTPKRNPALAAIDRLLFYSPMTNTPTTNTATIQKTNDVQEKAEPTEETSEETVNMAKELELVRSTVIQLEDQLEKLKLDNAEKETSYLEKINQLQAQLAQEIKNKNQITVVVDEYEKSISRLVAERERDRKNLDLEKAKLQEELAAAKHHLDNTEAAFNDVHLKYERLKAVVATYKSNEAALKESLQENVEIIKSLENRYEQVKSHATARLEKANQDLDAIRKQNESETVRLHAMVRKAELKSNSLAELVEQKTKENKELTQILDEVIARVGRNKSE